MNEIRSRERAPDNPATNLLLALAHNSPAEFARLCTQLPMPDSLQAVRALADMPVPDKVLRRLCNGMMLLDTPQREAAKEFWDALARRPWFSAESTLARMVHDRAWGGVRVALDNGADPAALMPVDGAWADVEPNFSVDQMVASAEVTAISALGAALLLNNNDLLGAEDGGPYGMLLGAAPFSEVPQMCDTDAYGMIDAVTLCALRGDLKGLRIVLSHLDPASPACAEGLGTAWWRMLALTEMPAARGSLGDVSMARVAALLLDAGMTVTQEDVDAYHAAFQTTLVHQIASLRINPSLKETALNALRAMAAAGVDLGVVETGRTLLHKAADMDDAALAGLALDAGVPADARNYVKKTALEAAQARGSGAVATAILAHAARGALLHAVTAPAVETKP